MTHPPDLVRKSLRDFWSDLGVADMDDATAPVASVPPRENLRPAIRNAVQPPSAAIARAKPRRLQTNPTLDASRLAAGARTLDELKLVIERFDGCPLKQASRTTVVADGVADAPVMIIGEAPGEGEDEIGRPFQGSPGALLDRMLATIGLSRNRNVYLTNLVYWRPPGKRGPTPSELQACAPFLTRQIEILQPRLLLTVGQVATRILLGTEASLMNLRGRSASVSREGLAHAIPCVPLLHPAYLLQRPGDKAKAWDDILSVASVCDELGIARDDGL
ncbi:MAG: uracil-DNA glycosylase [Alphaproteobacteria bacterium]|nr:uracil-DNA glycosylase [Alphaproteobacteria bacterium]